MKYLQNTWYPAAWDYEVGGGLLARIVLDSKIVFFRSSDGTTSALEDRCPHRFAPLSRGLQIDDAIQCGYHGLRFDRSGVCVHSPYSTTPPSRARVRSYPLIERHGLIWIWMGDPGLADANLVADLSFMNNTDRYRTVRGVTRMQSDYMLGIDNLMDLSHIEYLHGGTFGGQGFIPRGTFKVREADAAVHSDWWIPDIPNPPSEEHHFPMHGKHVDHWIDILWKAPASMLLDVGFTPTGQPREKGHHILGAHLLTPERDGVCHYFWSMGRTYARDSLEMDQIVRGFLVKAFDKEDKPMIEAVSEVMSDRDFWALNPVLLPIDEAAVRVRRLLAKLIHLESAGSA